MADVYAKQHGGFTYAEMRERGLPETCIYFCGMYAPHVHDGKRVHKIYYVYNHYVDDETYVKYWLPVSKYSVLFAVRYISEVDKLYHETAYMSYDKSVAVAMQMISNNGVETPGGRVLYRKFEPLLDLVLLASGVRKHFGVMSVCCGEVYKVTKSLRNVGMYKSLGHTEKEITMGMKHIQNKTSLCYGTVHSMGDFFVCYV